MRTDATDLKPAEHSHRGAASIDAFAPAHAPMSMPQQVLEASWFGRSVVTAMTPAMPQAVLARR
ncbi:hypothetical protein [Amorphus orientalis]|uniref:Uncharacterized protein n=1 Tax=Amorphus orientalis TaxID=649198 RepID=A0AAE3VKG0_9HYPH|nr:hypothetical protein [Amorphus orientalis]MDQ0314049.1 hypothetical protein [Amorphus orientalis]